MTLKKILFFTGLIFTLIFAFAAIIFSQPEKNTTFKVAFKNNTGEPLSLQVESSQCFDNVVQKIPKILNLGNTAVQTLEAKDNCTDPEIHFIIASQRGPGLVPIGQIFYNASEGKPFGIYQSNDPDYDLSASAVNGAFVIQINRKTKY